MVPPADVQLEREFLVGNAGEKARKDSRKLEGAAILPIEKHGTKHPGTGNHHFTCTGWR